LRCLQRYPWGLSPLKDKEQLGTGQVTAGGPELGGLGSGRVFESLMKEVGFCGIVFPFAEEEEEEEVVVVMGM